MSWRVTLRVGVLCGVLAAGSACHRVKLAEPPAGLTVAAAASLRGVMPEVGEAFTALTGVPVQFVYAGSGTLRQQIEAGQRVDVTILASEQDIARLMEQGLVLKDSVTVIARNTLVLIGTEKSAELRFNNLDKALVGKLAIGDPEAVPAGRYAKQALETLNMWSALEGRLVFVADVGQVLAYVKRGEVDAGVAYQTEARDLTDVRVLDTATSALGPKPIVVAAAVARSERVNDTRAFIGFLQTPQARTLLLRFGFEPPEATK